MSRLAQAREETLSRKMTRAKALLEEGAPVGEVARKIGLTVPNFRRAFKRRFGTAPQRLRPSTRGPIVSFRLTSDAELHQLEATAERAQVSVSTFVRRLVRRSLRLSPASDT